MTNKLTAQKPHLLRPIASPADLMKAQTEIRDLIKSMLKEGRDYGIIPGTKKPSLWKPGAEFFLVSCRCLAKFEIVEKEIDHDRPIQYIDKYGNKKLSLGIYRYVIRCMVYDYNGVEISQCIASCSTMESKYVYRPRDFENTVLKMAEKRAYIGATLTALALSDLFTQDTEDNPDLYRSKSSNKTQQAPKPKPQNTAPPGYQPENENHKKALVEALKRNKVEPQLWDNIEKLIVGKPMAALPEIIRKFDESQGVNSEGEAGTASESAPG